MDESFDNPKFRGWLWWAVCLLATVAIVVVAAVCGPADLFDDEQPKTISYTADIVLHDRWVLPREHRPISPTESGQGRPATKPPMYNWIGAGLIHLTGRWNDWVLKGPSLLAGGAILLMTGMMAGRLVRRLDRQTPLAGELSPDDRTSDFDAPYAGALATGLLAAGAWIANYAGFKVVDLARPDAVLAAWMLAAWLLADRLMLERSVGPGLRLVKASSAPASVTVTSISAADADAVASLESDSTAAEAGAGAATETSASPQVESATAATPAAGATSSHRASRIAITAGLQLLLWLCVAGAALTKGPPALLVPLFIVVGGRLMLGNYSSIRRTGLLWGMPVAIAIVGLWLYACWQVDADHVRSVYFGKETVQRVGQGGPLGIVTTSWQMPVWLIWRLLPWSVLAVAMFVITSTRGWGRPTGTRRAKRLWLRRQVRLWSRRAPGSAILWLVLGLAMFSLSGHKRPDYLDPMMPAAAILAAMVLRSAQRAPRHEPLRQFCQSVLRLSLLTALLAPLLLLIPRKPASVHVEVFDLAVLNPHWPTSYMALAAVMAACCVITSMIGLMMLSRRRIVESGMITAAATVALLGLVETRFGRAAETGAGDAIRAMVAIAQERAEAEDLPLVVYRTGYTPVQTLLHRNDADFLQAFEQIQREACIVIVSDYAEGDRLRLSGMANLRGAVPERLRPIAQTSMLPESYQMLVVVRVEPPLPPEPEPIE